MEKKEEERRGGEARARERRRGEAREREKKGRSKREREKRGGRGSKRGRGGRGRREDKGGGRKGRRGKEGGQRRGEGEEEEEGRKGRGVRDKEKREKREREVCHKQVKQVKQKGVCGHKMHYTILHVQSLKLPNHVEAVSAHNIHRRKDSVSHTTGRVSLFTLYTTLCVYQLCFMFNVYICLQCKRSCVYSVNKDQTDVRIYIVFFCMPDRGRGV